MRAADWRGRRRGVTKGIQQDRSGRRLNTRWRARVSGSTIWHAHRPSGRPASTSNLAVLLAACYFFQGRRHKDTASRQGPDD